MKRKKLIKNIDYKINNEKELILIGQEFTSRYEKMKIVINNKYSFLEYRFDERENDTEIYFIDGGELIISFSDLLETDENGNNLMSIEIY